jgi:hypothetical protein
MKVAPYFLLIFLSIFVGTSADFAQTQVSFNFEGPLFSYVNITNVIIGSDPLYAGTSTDILITLINTGTISTSAIVNVSILNSNDTQVDLVIFDPVIVMPGTSVTISKSWSTALHGVGLFLANASSSYESGANITNSFSRSFSIISYPPTPTTIPPGGSSTDGSSSSGGNAGGKPIPTPTIIPDIRPTVAGAIRFLKTTVLKEMAPGDAAFESIVIKNIEGGEKKVKFSISGVNGDWISFYPTESILLFGESRVINLGLTIPSDAYAGDYLVKIQASENNQTAIEYLALRIKHPNKEAQFPFVAKTIRLDRTSLTTSITIDVRNPTSDVQSSIFITEEMLPSLKVSAGDIKFETKPPYENIEGDPLKIKWQISKLMPGEVARISYSVPTLLSEYRPYVYWTVRQIELMPKDLLPSDMVAIKEISAPPIPEGGWGDMEVKVFNGGFDALSYKAVLEVPDGFEVNPASIEDKLVARGISTLKYSVKSPSKSAGTHTVTLSLLLEGNHAVQGNGYVLVQGAISLSLQIIAMFILIVIIFGISIFTYLKRRQKQKDRRHAVEFREGYIKQIKDHIRPPK